MQIPLLSGVSSNLNAEFDLSYPTNLEPIIIDSKISKGQLRHPSGAVALSTGPGIDRGGINWDGVCYRVMGPKLVKVAQDGAITEIGTVGGTGPVTLEYGFDRLGIRSGTNLFYYDKITLTQVTDPDLGPVVDAIWFDSYWMTTDGTHIGVMELSDPTQASPLKYGSAEEDPDPLTGLIRVPGRAEVNWIGRHTIQVARNVGGNGFPFAPIKGASIPYGCVSASAKSLFMNSFAFVGSKRNDALGVYVAGQGDADKISTRKVDDALAQVEDPASIILESRSYRDEQRLFVHLPNETWVFLAQASAKAQEPVWYRAASGTGDPYRLRNSVAVYGRIMVADVGSAQLGWLSEDVTTHFGAATEWVLHAGYLFNDGKGGILHSAELIGLPGRGTGSDEVTAFMSLTRDGTTYSVERAINLGRPGQRAKRMQWRPHARFALYMGLRFRGYNKALPGFARLEADVRPLAA